MSEATPFCPDCLSRLDEDEAGCPACGVPLAGRVPLRMTWAEHAALPRRRCGHCSVAMPVSAARCPVCGRTQDGEVR